MWNAVKFFVRLYRNCLYLRFIDLLLESESGSGFVIPNNVMFNLMCMCHKKCICNKRVHVLFPQKNKNRFSFPPNLQTGSAGLQPFFYSLLILVVIIISQLFVRLIKIAHHNIIETWKYSKILCYYPV